MAVSKERVNLLLELEELIGNQCYHPKMANHGPGGVRQRDGRGFRYPITFIDAEGKKDKRWTITPQAVPPPDIAMTGYYQIGVSKLSIMRALNNVIEHLERKHNLKVD